MGRKNATSSAKSKEKRMQRKEEQQRISQAMSIIALANQLEDPLADFPVFQNFNKNGISCHLFVKRSSKLSETEKGWIFNLTKKNMQLKYEQCSWGWNDKKKMEELYDERAWFLLAANCIDQSYLAFSHFRFDIDMGIEVLYCYELQLETHVQRKGLGKFMMQVLELMAFKNNMKKVVLTVLKNNPNSKFFKAIGYELDESCPIDDEEETYPYEILSKLNKRLASALPAVNVRNPNHIYDNNQGHSHSNGHCCPGHLH
ncbi:N-alpha-acetyltransferase 40 [Cylas formicarius]|uniref:N-alpha-acetyltransferase 40 n=1 Tax=Cylas formicarius TaxID=197179 RepID=UPI0029589A44|nr:N-alpha-acetyltransferase 40 [Cylas formicarius]XP_060536218.1 N-alpha-acetyltransferase 40 [Cylas formicarius]